MNSLKGLQEWQQVSINGLRISTYWEDVSWGTLIEDANGKHTVEFYDSEDAALAGHKEWLRKSHGLKEITGTNGQKVTLKHITHLL